jgi:hypothetical protein
VCTRDDSIQWQRPGHPPFNVDSSCQDPSDGRHPNALNCFKNRVTYHLAMNQLCVHRHLLGTSDRLQMQDYCCCDRDSEGHGTSGHAEESPGLCTWQLQST